MSFATLKRIVPGVGLAALVGVVSVLIAVAEEWIFGHGIIGQAGGARYSLGEPAARGFPLGVVLHQHRRRAAQIHAARREPLAHQGGELLAAVR